MFISLRPQSVHATNPSVPHFGNKKNKNKNKIKPDTFTRSDSDSQASEIVIPTGRDKHKKIKTPDNKTAMKAIVSEISDFPGQTPTRAMRRQAKEKVLQQPQLVAESITAIKNQDEAQLNHLFKNGLNAKLFLAAHRGHYSDGFQKVLTPYEQIVDKLLVLPEGPQLLKVITTHLTQQLPEDNIPRHFVRAIQKLDNSKFFNSEYWRKYLAEFPPVVIAELHK